MIQCALQSKNEHIYAYSALGTDALFLYHDICGVALNKVFSKTDGKIYPTVYLSEVADFLQGLTYSPSDVAKSGYLVLRSSNIQNGILSFDDCVYVDKSIPENLQVKYADVIMCVRNGSKNLVGKSALIPNDMPMTTWGAFMMIVRSKLNDTYIFHYLNSQMFFSQVFKDTGTATINQITKGILNESPSRFCGCSSSS